MDAFRVLRWHPLGTARNKRRLIADDSRKTCRLPSVVCRLLTGQNNISGKTVPKLALWVEMRRSCFNKAGSWINNLILRCYSLDESTFSMLTESVSSSLRDSIFDGEYIMRHVRKRQEMCHKNTNTGTLPFVF